MASLVECPCTPPTSWQHPSHLPQGPYPHVLVHTDTSLKTGNEPASGHFDLYPLWYSEGRSPGSSNPEFLVWMSCFPKAARTGVLTCGYLRLMDVRAPAGSLASSESRTACTVVALAWWVSVST